MGNGFAALHATPNSPPPPPTPTQDGDNNPVGGVGHLNVNGAGTRNQFGLDFQDKKIGGGVWTKALCERDSDGDGLSNGVELGDPECVWVKGGLAPQFDTGISHPGQKNGEEVSRARDSCEKYAAPTAAAVAAHDAASVNLTFTPPYNVPTKRTTYTKFAFNMFDIAKTAGLDQGTAAKTLFGTRFGVVNKHENVVHHMILYACDKKVAFIGKPLHGDRSLARLEILPHSLSARPPSPPTPI